MLIGQAAQGGMARGCQTDQRFNFSLAADAERIAEHRSAIVNELSEIFDFHQEITSFSAKLRTKTQASELIQY
ncbi:hypothetical protein JKG68_00700 [Microvirga aerilata]|uniref:Uncharacterized protein n=1 Tax=Microvirga aerilata TaxID=670292 RepID=A0A937CY60_9HYPH|nr:hypothetical protein [Microvirga aerilata]MBL0402482.1 hypothetical protein [Microvirga aerilata]